MSFTIGDILRIANSLLEEGFKDDVISAYKKNGVDVSNDEKFLRAVKLFNTDNDIKSKIKKEVGNINGNIGIAVARKYTNPQGFVDFVNKFSTDLSQKREEQKVHTAKKQSSDVQENDDFYVYACRTFESAKSASIKHTGNLERLGNQKIKEKYGIDVPEPANHFKTDKSPKEFLEWMKEVPFFMNPSWCICADKKYWDMYKLAAGENELPNCNIIISKKYPNLRFCITRKVNVINKKGYRGYK